MEKQTEKKNSKNIASKAIRAVIFVIICAVGFMVIGQGLIIMDDGKLASIKCGQYYKLEEDSLDVLVVGASTLKGGYSPDIMYEETGIVSYQRGTSAMPPSLFYYSVKEALKSQHPSLVILDAGQLYKKYHYEKDEAVCMTLDANIDFCHLNRDKVEAAKLISSMTKYEDFIENIFPMFKYHNRWKSVSAKDFITAVKTPYDKLMGQSLYLETHKQKTLMGHMETSGSKSIKPFDKQGLKSFNKAIKFCKEQGVEVLLFRAPRGDWSTYDYQGLKNYADKMGVEYLDMNFDNIVTDAGIDADSDFHNSHHLNYKGAEKMTRWLGHYLMKNYDINTKDTSASAEKQMKKNVEYYYDFLEKSLK